MICVTVTLRKCSYAMSLGKQPRHHTMLRRDGNTEKFWSVARRCAAGNQLAAVSDIRTGSPLVASFTPVHIVPFPAVKHFPTARNDAFVAQNFLNTRA